MLLVTVACDLLSSALVASSKIKIAGRAANARAIKFLCRCPPEMLPEPSPITVCIPIGIFLISSAIPAASAAAHASSCVKFAVPIIFVKISPCISCPFCKTTPICERTEGKLNSDKSCPSNEMLPLFGFSKPSKSRTNVDLPQPLFPTIAKFSPALMSKLKPFKTSGDFSPYEKVKLLTVTAPLNTPASALSSVVSGSSSRIGRKFSMCG